MSRPPEHSIRILAWPAFRTRENNPYPWLLYTNLVGLGVHVDEYTPWRAFRESYDVVHIHWPDYQLATTSRVMALLRLLYLSLVIRWCKWRGARLVWTVHNLASHEATHPRLEAVLWRMVTKRVDACLCLTHSGQAAAIERFPL